MNTSQRSTLARAQTYARHILNLIGVIDDLERQLEIERAKNRTCDVYACNFETDPP